MIVILSIIALVAAVSFYDYFGSRGWQQVTSSTRNNAVFEKRNKDYGAYVIRRDYDKTLLIIMISFVFSTGLIFAGYLGFKNDPKPIAFKPPVVVDIDPNPEILTKDEPVKVVKIEKVIEESHEATLEFKIPEVTDEEIKEKQRIQDELEKAKAAALEAEQKGKGTFIPVLGNKKDTTESTPKGPVDWVDVEAEYPGGFPAMMKFIQDKFRVPDIAHDINASGKVFLKFVVGEDGSISSIKVQRGIPNCPECDKEAIRVLKMMPNWKPGKIRGKAVSSYFNLPINIDLQ